MRIDRTWTISFEDHEFKRLLSEIEAIKFPPDLGWKPILWQVSTARQITLPLRAVERLSLELDITRSCYGENLSLKDYQNRFPMVASLSTEVDAILYCANKRKSA